MAGHRLVMGIRGPTYCLMCGGFVDFDLPTDCPNRPMTPMECANIMDGKLNCINGHFMWAPNVVEVAGRPDEISVSQPVLN
ncbi:hypothetical protein D3C76_407170 [compost metagenome]